MRNRFSTSLIKGASRSWYREDSGFSIQVTLGLRNSTKSVAAKICCLLNSKLRNPVVLALERGAQSGDIQIKSKYPVVKNLSLSLPSSVFMYPLQLHISAQWVGANFESQSYAVYSIFTPGKKS